MCDICHQTPCHPRCPNAPEQSPVYTCYDCGCGIYVGDKVYRIEGHTYCEDCIESYCSEAEEYWYETY